MAVQRRRGFLRRSLQACGAALSALAVLGRRRAVGQAGMVSGFDHVAVPMRNTDAMLRFYRDLGFHVKEGERICSVHFGDHKINLHRPALWQSEQFTLRAPAAEPPCGDFCFVWDGTESALAEALTRAGAEVVTGPVLRTGGRSGGTAQGTSRYTRDPDGNLLEFIVY